MSTMNPLKFMGGLVLEIGAVIAVLAIIPGLGGSEALRLTGANSSPAGDSFASNRLAQAPMTNQVFFDAQSSRVLEKPNQQRTAPQAAWQNDLVPPPPVAQQRFVEEMLDHNSQRAIDTATRIWNQGDRLLPPELRVRPESAEDLAASNYRVPQHTGEPIRELNQRRPVAAYQTEEYRPNDGIVPEYVVPPTAADSTYSRPSHYAPSVNPAPSRNPAPNSLLPSNSTPRYSAQDQSRRIDERY